MPDNQKKKGKGDAGSRRPEKYRRRHEQNKCRREVERELLLSVLACETMSNSGVRPYGEKMNRR